MQYIQTFNQNFQSIFEQFLELVFYVMFVAFALCYLFTMSVCSSHIFHEQILIKIQD